MANPILYLIDGSAYIYRNYHAIRNLSSSKGEPTNASFGFTRTLQKLIATCKPEYVGVLFDTKGPTFRHGIYPEYKANRPPMPDDLACQIPRIHAISEAMGLKILSLQGWEADDLAGTLADKARKEGFEVVLVTGDKDFLQLIDNRTKIFDPMKDVWNDEETLREQFGFGPEGIIQMMALTGDSSDNIPGVPGIGPKTATSLVQEYGTLENIYEALPKMGKKKMVENLAENRDKAFLSRELVTIDIHAPVDFSPEDWKKHPIEAEKLTALFRELDFRGLLESMKKELEEGTPTDPAEKGDYRAILSVEDLKALVAEIKKAGIMAFDTETTGLDSFSAKLVGISLSSRTHEAVYIPVGHTDLHFPPQLSLDTVRKHLHPLFSDSKIVKIAHNLKYDWAILSHHGFTLENPLKDTLLASYLIDPTRNSHSLDELAMDLLNHKNISYEEAVGGKKAGFETASFENAVPYAAEDADIALRLWEKLSAGLHSKNLVPLFEKLEMPLLPVLMKMEECGIRVDQERLKSLSKKMAEELEELTGEICKLAGEEFNINSPQQLGHILFDVLNLPVQKKTKKKTGYSTDVSVLESLSALHPLPEKILRQRTLAKLKNTYADALQELVHKDGRIHTSFNQGVTATGRLSSSNPNLQNIPVRSMEGREIRKVFIPEDGWIMMSADYSQIELRLLAHYSEDPILIEAFKKGEDIHMRTATEIFQTLPGMITDELRRQAKTINFGILYGMSAFRLANELGISQKMAQTYIDHYFARYKGVKDFIEKTKEEAAKNGFTTTLLGRIRPIPDIHSPNFNLRQNAERIAVNTPIQGSAADILKMAMIRIDDGLAKEKFQARMLLTVHDELVFELPPEEKEKVTELVKESMENVVSLKVKLEVNIGFGKNWSEAH